MWTSVSRCLEELVLEGGREAVEAQVGQHERHAVRAGLLRPGLATCPLSTIFQDSEVSIQSYSVMRIIQVLSGLPRATLSGFRVQAAAAEVERE